MYTSSASEKQYKNLVAETIQYENDKIEVKQKCVYEWKYNSFTIDVDLIKYMRYTIDLAMSYKMDFFATLGYVQVLYCRSTYVQRYEALSQKKIVKSSN